MSDDFWVSFIVGLALGGMIIQCILSNGKTKNTSVSIMDTEKW
jgi:hypothetical protein